MHKQGKRANKSPDIFYPWQVEQMTGLPVTTLHSWRRSGFYEPLERRHELRYRFRDLCVLVCLSTMRSRGMSVQRMRAEQLPQLLEYIDKALVDEFQLTDLRFTLLTGKKVLVYASRGHYTEWKPNPKWLVDFGELRKAVDDIKPNLRKSGTRVGVDV